MQFDQTRIPEVVLIKPKKFNDSRGYFMETFRQALFEANIGSFEFVQENQSLSLEVGTVRGLHFQSEPEAQGKLVRCVSGALVDVAVDIRRGSPTFGEHVAVELTPESGHQLWVPPGFAHGFCTLTANTEVSYKVTNYYSANHDRGLLWNDPVLAIDWPVDSDKAALSDKDKRHPPLAQLPDAFTY